jgi:predicted nucleic acid-binding protein
VLNILATAPNTIFAEPFYHWHLITTDVDDNKFVDLAIGISADYLISNDKDFNCLKAIDFPKVHSLTLDEFKTILKI